MTHAFELQYCRGCLPVGYGEALTTMEKVLLGERDVETWLCSDHRQKMNDALYEHLRE